MDSMHKCITFKSNHGIRILLHPVLIIYISRFFFGGKHITFGIETFGYGIPLIQHLAAV